MSKNESRNRSYSTSSSCKTFGQIVFHSPLNRQNITNREYQEGNVQQVRMKTFVRAIDSRVDKVERNRQNFFSQQQSNNTFQTKTPPLLNSATRHGKTPYDYCTSWIDHPDENTSLSPAKSELYFTSFLQAPNTTADFDRRSKSSLSRYEAIRLNQAHFKDYVDQIDEKIASTHNKNMEDIRAQRKLHLEALEIRNKIEKIDTL